MAAPRCLYCGEALSSATVAAAAASREATLAPAAPEGPPRALVVLDAAAAPADLARALGESAYEGAQRARRRGLQLWHVVPAEEGVTEAARLREAGIAAWALPEAEVKGALLPRAASRGGPAAGGLRLVAERSDVRLTARDLLLVVKGPIVREYQAAESKARRLRTAGLEPGYRFSLHVHTDPRPLELDPAEFDFGSSSQGVSALLQLAGWIADLAAGVPVDDEFRRLPPALGAALPAHGVAAALDGRSQHRGREEGRAILDNLAQFRFYSAWRAAVQRRR
jgi:hypothetical protein